MVPVNVAGVWNVNPSRAKVVIVSACKKEGEMRSPRPNRDKIRFSIISPRIVVSSFSGLPSLVWTEYGTTRPISANDQENVRGTAWRTGASLLAFQFGVLLIAGWAG
jgi:hypothetical protein